MVGSLSFPHDHLFPPLLNNHACALSESLYIFLTLTGFHLLACDLSKPRPGKQMLASIGVASAFMARYVGLTNLITALVALMLFQQGSFMTRIRRSLFFAITACAIPAAWCLRNAIAAGTLLSRTLAWHPPQAQNLRSLLTTVALCSFQMICQLLYCPCWSCHARDGRFVVLHDHSESRPLHT